MIEATIETVVVDHNRNAVPEGCMTHTIAKKDKYEELLGRGEGRISVTLGETLPGPIGYSSIKVSVTITLTCQQDSETMAKARGLAFEEGIDFLDTYCDKAVQVLGAHIDRVLSEG